MTFRSWQFLQESHPMLLAFLAPLLSNLLGRLQPLCWLKTLSAELMWPFVAQAANR